MHMLEVVAGLIHDGKRFLICRRPAHKARALQWEFPGGKIEAGESGEAALIREIREELGAGIAVEKKLTDVVHAYPDLSIHLTLYLARVTFGEIQKLEHSDVRWITADQIPNYDFCPADRAFLAKITEEFQ